MGKALLYFIAFSQCLQYMAVYAQYGRNDNYLPYPPSLFEDFNIGSIVDSPDSDFNVFPLIYKSKKQCLGTARKFEVIVNDAFLKPFSFSPSANIPDGKSNDEKKSVKELDDNGSEIAKAHGNDRAECIQKHFYKLDMSFKEINDFKVGLHILLILSIMYLAKKTYDQISK